MDNKLYMKEKFLLTEYEETLAREEIFWKKKARQNWLEFGDKNTKFFHNSTKQRRLVNRITKIKIESGSPNYSPEVIGAKEIEYFMNIFNNRDGSILSLQNEVLKCIPKIINKDQNQLLNVEFSKIEIERALFQMNPDKAPGPNGFPTTFFQKCWHFIGDEVIEALEGIRNSGKIRKELNK
ncbi:uncharacterized protein LOC131874863 [Cryptomeria japonica]|uniref:uncharacterized protein LOC131874863 n=1 Tax=Cryptomeria japonica TaxID=3369 RepID=UPI0027DA0FF3|nr:uncharacterized protein LOC131874863 [Cryptomeria japonica]